jgi:hypothetical protein
MADTEILDSVREWCEAQAQYDQENFPGGFPRYSTAYRLYHAGRALYDATGVEAADGRYSINRWFEKPTAQTQGLLNDNKKETNDEI